MFLVHVSRHLVGGIGGHVVRIVIGTVHLVLHMVLRFKVVTSSVVHVPVTMYVAVETNLGIMAIIGFKDKAEHGACSVEETLATVLIWGVLVASLLPGASINKIRI